MFTHFETYSNHGTSEGVLPRFYLQMKDLGDMVFGQVEFDRRSDVYVEKVIPELTNLYDMFHGLQQLISTYKSGVADGTFFQFSEGGVAHFDRIMEIEIDNLVKNTILRCKIALISFSKCGVVDDDGFVFDNFFRCSISDRAKRKKEYSDMTDGRYLPLVTLIENAESTFLASLNNVRGEMEHELYSLPKFILNVNGNRATLEEPTIQGRKLSNLLALFYENSLDLVEKSVAYFIGLNGERKFRDFYKLEVNEDYDYTKMRYKYRFSLGGLSWSSTAKRCTYD
jgi:hypothetical protein